MRSRSIFFLSLVPAAVACGGAQAPSKEAAHEGTDVATTAASAPSNATPSPAAPSPAPSPAQSLASSDASPSPSSSAPASSASAAATSAQVAAAAHPKKIAARHILIQWMGCQSSSTSVIRTRDQAHAVAVDVLRRLKGGEDFARLVVEFSDEPNAGARGGSLGRFGHGAMVREFEDAAFALKPGELSDIVESPFGFHLIQRTE